jgi:hypothetical protein
MTLPSRLDELERRVKAALASPLRRAAAELPAWRAFEASLREQTVASVTVPQNGGSSSPPEATRLPAEPPI